MRGLLTICKTLVAVIWVGIQFLPPTTAAPNYPVRELTLVDEDGDLGERYSRFIEELRELVTGDRDVHGIPRLRSTVDIGQRFILVELTNEQGATVTLAVDVTNLYVVAFGSGGHAYFFNDNTDPDATLHVFADANRQTLTVGGNYAALGDRSRTALGRHALNEAIKALSDFATRHAHVVPRDMLLVCIQMFAEAVRFRPIQLQMREIIDSYQDRSPDLDITELENNWATLSHQIQTATQGTFGTAVSLYRLGNQQWLVDSVNQLIAVMGIMLYRCANQPTSNRKPRSAPTYESNQDVCEYNEPTARIAGPNGLCVDVYKGWWHNGNSIISWPCKTNTDANQLWTLKTDGTIRSNGKCLTTYGSSLGSYMMIYDCAAAVEYAIHWEVWDNGTIINPKSGLALTAKSLDQGVTLTVETNNYTISQSWRPTNITIPYVSSIVGYKNLCLQGNGENVWVEKCAAYEQEQQWALYPDGSMRPKARQQYCLTGNTDIVKILSCQYASSAQRWEFKNDGSILNLNSGLVMDVRRSDPSLKQIIIWPSHGGKNQKWIAVS